VGRVTGIESQGVWVQIDGERTLPYRWVETSDLKHAFAASIHKAQGSEYPAVVMPMTTQHYMMLRRNLFYTAVTRAEKLAVLVGSRQAVHIAVNNDDAPLRRSGLRARL
jgi:exodeoxyribonuclease V alpha subunit